MKVLRQIEKLEKQNKQLTSELSTCKSELDKMREENVVLRDANIQFQVKLFKLNVQAQNQNGTAEPSTSTPVQKRSTQKPSTAQNSIRESLRKVPVIAKVECNLSQDNAFDDDFDVIDDQDDSQTSKAKNAQDDDNSDSTQYDRRSYKIDPELMPRKNESQPDIQTRFKIKLGPMKLAQLNNIDPGILSDGKFVNTLLPWLFDRETLLISTVTGKKYRNQYGELVTDNPPLDPRRLSFMRCKIALFKYL
jgi:hypothetical protein